MERILVVDDIQDNVKLLAYELTDAGYDVAVAYSGAQALAEAAAVTPDCVLLDVMMPGMDGYEACRRMKADPRLRSVPVIMVSAKDAVDDVIQGLDSGAVDYITKPFNARIVVARIQAAVRVKRASEIIERMNAQLDEARRKADEANAAKSMFLANMSHEIRTPMSAILGFAELLESAVDETNRETVRIVRRNGDHLLELINDILDLSKIEAGQLEVERIPCAPRAIVEEVVTLMRGRLKTDAVSLSATFEGPIPSMVVTDPTRVRQILLNLVGNAVKFTKEGSVRLETSLVRRSDGRQMLRFRVVDTGIGMTPEQIGRLFRPYSQADTSTARKFGGTGLGLAISKRLAEIMGGEIAASGELGRGTTITVTIDPGTLKGVELEAGCDVRATAGASAAKCASKDRSLIERRVLLADDGPDNRRLFSFILQKAGAEVTLAENGQEAFELAAAALAEKRPFDVVLMDMQMPETDGYTATRKLRDLGYVRPIVALTAYAMSSDRQKCVEAGCDDYLTKPVDRRTLLTVVARHCDAAVRMSTACSV